MINLRAHSRHMPQRIVLTGGPSTGKTAIIQALEAQGQLCMQEISREVTQAARQQGIEQLFVSDPLAFSQALFEGRKTQFIESGQIESPRVFLDRGIIEVFGPTGITYLIKNATVYLSSLQSGYIYNYAFTIFLATTVFLIFIGNITFSLLQIQVLL